MKGIGALTRVAQDWFGNSGRAALPPACLEIMVKGSNAMDFVEQLKSSIDIVSVVGEYVRLRKAGTRYVGLCPFHSEKTPSFGVHATHQFYKCFGCGAGGDVIKFVMEIEGFTFYQALEHLSEKFGIPMPKKTRYSDEETQQRTAIYEMHEVAGQYFRHALESNAGTGAREYIQKRGLSEETAAEFGLGFVERSGQGLVRLFQNKGFRADHMEASGLVLKRREDGRYYDRFRGRLMFPIHNESGKIIAFAGRAMSPEDEPKYMNSPETPIYRKSFVLYNLHRARKQIRQRDRGILVEGYMDVIGLYDAGVGEAVASCGTALTSQQVRALHRHSDKIVVNFDPDAAGSNAAERSVQMLLEEGMHIRVLQLPGGLDPDEYVRTEGAEAYRRQLEQASGYFRWLADRVRGQADMDTAEGRMEGLRNVLMPAIRRIPDRLERAVVAEDVASYLRVDPEVVRSEFRRSSPAPEEPPREQPATPRVHPGEKLLIHVLMTRPEARPEVLPRLKKIEAVKQLQLWPILKVMLQLQEAEDNWNYTDLENRLEENARALLASVAFADAMGEENASLEQALAFIPQLERREKESRLADMKERIREAEKAGDFAEVIRLAEELKRVDTS